MDFRHFLEMSYQPSKHRGAGILPIARSSGKILLGLRAMGGGHEETWASFGGGAGNKETPRQTALREFYEETGFSGKIGLMPFWIGTSGPSKNPKRVYHLFVGIVPTEFEPKLNMEHSEAKWFTYDEAKKLKNKHPKLDQLFTLADSELKEICRVRSNRTT